MNGPKSTAPGVGAGQKPSKVIFVPEEFRRFTSAEEGRSLVYHVLVETNCTLVPLWDRGKIYRFDIYGHNTAVENAVGSINNWMASTHAQSKVSAAWGKTPAFDPDKWYYDRVAELEGERKQMFKGPVPKMPKGAPEPFRVSRITSLDVTKG